MTVSDEGYDYLLSPLSLAVTLTQGEAAEYQHAEHLQLLSAELVQLTRRAPGWPRRLLVTMPPRHGKSELVSHWFPVWNLALRPYHQVILCSYEADYAAKWGRKVRTTLMQNYASLGTRIMDDSRAANRWETVEKGGMTTAGVNGPITGRGGNLLILDDPVKNAEAANSATIRDNAWAWWTTTFLTREQPPLTSDDETVIVLIMTRWHEDDLAGRLIASPDFKLSWRHIDLPALALDADALGRPAGGALWPEMFGVEWLQKKAAEIGPRAFTALYQQKPTPPEGAGINRGWWKWYDPEISPEELALQMDEVWISVDPTFKEVDSADFCAIQAWGRKGDRFIGLHGMKERMGTVKTMEEIREFRRMFPRARVAIEETASGAAIAELLEREIGRIDRVTPKGSKETRLNWAVGAAAPFVARGAVSLPKGARWAQELVNEGASFPHAAHDDAVDCFTQAIAKMVPKSWAWEGVQKRIAKMVRAENPKEGMALRLRGWIADRIKARQAPKRNPGLPGL
jgi:predicted phage terminase large subunit-like protein